MENQNVGLFLQKLRKEKGLTQGQLAAKFNLTHQSVSKWEKGESLPDIHVLKEIAKFYELTIEEILNAEKKEDSKPPRNEKVQSLLNLERMYVAFLIGIFISFAFFYIHQEATMSDLFGDLGGVFEDGYITMNIRGYNLIFGATSITLYTIAMWLIFLSVITLLLFKTMNIYSIIKYNKVHSITDLKLKFNVVYMLEALVVLCYILMALGMLFMSSISMGIGFFIGILFVSLIYVLKRIESKQTVVSK